MTTRHLKIGDEWVMGKNGKKLRYLFNKDDKTIILKVPSNWTENAHNDVKDKYEGFTVNEDIVKKRGSRFGVRPVLKSPVGALKIGHLAN